MSNKVKIRPLHTGVPGLDNLLGGGLPEFSFNLITGSPGSGKTTLAHQIMFSLVDQEHRALYFTVCGEPAFKMLRYQQQFPFFDTSKVNETVKFVNLSSDLVDGDFDRTMGRIAEEVKNYSPSLVIVDSFLSLLRTAHQGEQAVASQQHFVHALGQLMASWQATTFLVGEYINAEVEASPIFTVADGILALSQNFHHNSMIRKIQVNKMRGQAQATGMHTFRISDEGIQIFPRAIIQTSVEQANSAKRKVGNVRTSMGISGLDTMFGGGLPVGYSLLVVGPSGSGKTILATEFLAEGVRLGETGVMAAFEKSPSQLLNSKLLKMIQAGKVSAIDTRSLDLSIDETLYNLIHMIKKTDARRIVIDSLSGFELALAPEFNEDFRGSLYRLIAELTSMGVTILMTSELEDRYTDLRFSPFGNAFLADAIVMQRYIELNGKLKRVISVVKVRGSAHSEDINLFTIGDDGITIGKTLSGYHGILAGQPTADL